MARSTSPTVGMRWQRRMGHDEDRRNEALERTRQEVQEQVLQETSSALSGEIYGSNPSETPQPSHPPTPRIYRDAGRNTGMQSSGGGTTEASQPAALSTPPNFPSASQITMLQLNGVDPHNIEQCRRRVNELQATINSLRSTLHNNETECQDLHEERWQTSRSCRDAVRNDQSAESERLKTIIKSLDDLLEEKDKTIRDLHTQILDLNRSKRDLETRLAESESTVRARERDASSTGEEQNATSIADVSRRHHPVLQPEPEPPLDGHRRRRSSAVRGNGWAVVCPNGQRKSSITIAKEMVRRKRS